MTVLDKSTAEDVDCRERGDKWGVKYNRFINNQNDTQWSC